MPKPRVLIVGPLPPPVGGVENYTQALLESAALDEFEIAHCDLTKGRPKQKQGKFDSGNLQWALIHFGRMRRHMREFKPDLVYLPVSASWVGFFRDATLAGIAKKGKAKLVGHVHGGWFDRILAAKGWKERIVRRTLKRFDTLLVLGTPWLKMLRDYGFTGPTGIVPATTREEVFDRGESFHRSYGEKGAGGFFLGQVGRRKGVYDLLAALAQLRAEGQPQRITFTGPGEFDGEWEAVMKTREELGLQDLAEFTGPLQAEELYERFRKADYFIMPSYEEGMPAVLFEAGAFGLPTITTPVGAVSDLLHHEQNALLVQPGNVETIKEAILRLSGDQALRVRLGTALQRDIQAYRPAKVMSQVADAIRKALQ